MPGSDKSKSYDLVDVVLLLCQQALALTNSGSFPGLAEPDRTN